MPLKARGNERRGLCNMSKLGGSITRIAIMEGLGVVVIDNTGPIVNVMMGVGAGQILEDGGRGEGGDAIKIRLAGMERESLESSLAPCMRHTHALQPRLLIRLLSPRKRST